MQVTNEELQFIDKCQFCKRKYVPGDSEVLKRKRDLSMILVECPLCKGSILVMILRGAMGLVTTIGIPTDLIKADLKRMKMFYPVTLDDVLVIHSHLKSLSHGNIGRQKTRNFR